MKPSKIGQSPDMIQNKELLPHPFGPEISKCIPGRTLIDKLGTTMSQFGVMIGTWSSTIDPSIDSVAMPLETGSPFTNSRFKAAFETPLLPLAVATTCLWYFPAEQSSKT